MYLRANKHRSRKVCDAVAPAGEPRKKRSKARSGHMASMMVDRSVWHSDDANADGLPKICSRMKTVQSGISRQDSNGIDRFDGGANRTQTNCSPSFDR